MRGRIGVLMGITLTLVLAAGCSGAPAKPDTPASQNPADGSADAAGLVRQECTRCHSVSRIKWAGHDTAGWTDTVTRMRERGAHLTDAEAQQIITFLASGGGEQL